VLTNFRVIDTYFGRWSTTTRTGFRISRAAAAGHTHNGQMQPSAVIETLFYGPFFDTPGRCRQHLNAPTQRSGVDVMFTQQLL
jgi:hypothetical protein